MPNIEKLGVLFAHALFGPLYRGTHMPTQRCAHSTCVKALPRNGSMCNTEFTSGDAQLAPSRVKDAEG